MGSGWLKAQDILFILPLPCQIHRYCHKPHEKHHPQQCQAHPWHCCSWWCHLNILGRTDSDCFYYHNNLSLWFQETSCRFALILLKEELNPEAALLLWNTLGIPVFPWCTHARLNANVTQKQLCTAHCKEEGAGVENTAPAFIENWIMNCFCSLTATSQAVLEPKSQLFSSQKGPAPKQFSFHVQIAVFCFTAVCPWDPEHRYHEQ